MKPEQTSNESGNGDGTLAVKGLLAKKKKKKEVNKGMETVSFRCWSFILIIYGAALMNVVHMPP